MREPFVQVDRLDLPEGVWTEVVRRSGAPEWVPEPPETGPSRSRRAVVIAVAFALFATAAVFAWQALAPAERHSRPADPSPSPAALDLDPLAALPVGWSELPAPPEVRSEAASAWTGHDLLIWGGYVFEGSGDKAPNDDGFTFDAVTQSWTTMPASPLSPRSAAASAWTGSELVIWGGWDGTDEGATPGVLGDGAAYDPASASWRMLPPAPISGRAPLSVWTGTELIVWGSGMRTPDLPRDGAAYDPVENTWRAMALSPIELSDATAVWTGREMIAFGAALSGGNHAATSVAVGAAYDPASDSWRTIADSELSPQASTAAWNSEALIAWDYLNASAAYDPNTDAWRSLPDVPLDVAECSPESVGIGRAVFGDYCGITTLFDPRSQTWTDLSRQAPSGGWVMEPVAAGEVALLPSHDLRTGEVRMLAFRPPTASETEGRTLTEGTSHGVRWSLVADTSGVDPVLELRTAEGEDVRLSADGSDGLRTAVREFGRFDPDDVVVFGFAPAGTDEVRLVPGQGLPERTAQPLAVPGTERPAFVLTAYAGIGIVTATSGDGAVLAEELLVPPGGDRVLPVVQEFLAARIQGEGAEGFLARGESESFGPGRGDLAPLYGPPTGPGYVGSSIEFIDGADPPDGWFEVGVVLRVEGGPPVEETLFLGQGVNEDGEARHVLVHGGRPGLTGP